MYTNKTHDGRLLFDKSNSKAPDNHRAVFITILRYSLKSYKKWLSMTLVAILFGKFD